VVEIVPKLSSSDTQEKEVIELVEKLKIEKIDTSSCSKVIKKEEPLKITPKRVLFPELIGFRPFIINTTNDSKVVVAVPKIENATVSFTFTSSQTLMTNIVIPAPTINDILDISNDLKPVEPIVSTPISMEFETNLGVEVYQSPENCKIYHGGT